VCTVDVGCYAMCAGGRATCDGGGGGHATCVLEVVEVVFHVVEAVDDMGRVLEVAEGLGRLQEVVDAVRCMVEVVKACSVCAGGGGGRDPCGGGCGWFATRHMVETVEGMVCMAEVKVVLCMLKVVEVCALCDACDEVGVSRGRYATYAGGYGNVVVDMRRVMVVDASRRRRCDKKNFLKKKKYLPATGCT